MDTHKTQWRAAYDAQSPPGDDAVGRREYNGYRNARTYALLHASLRRATADWAGLRVLDVGSGTGDTNGFLATHNHVTALDFSARMLALARARYPDVALGDGERLPFCAGAFDAVIATGVWQCLPEAAPLPREAARVLRPGGRLVLGWALNADFLLYRRGVRSRLAEGLTLTPRPLDAMRAALRAAGFAQVTPYAAVYPLGVWRGAGPRALVPAYTLAARL